MVKRATNDVDGAAAFRKRQKLTHDVPIGEEVTSSDQLRKLLAFDQDLQRVRHGTQTARPIRHDAMVNQWNEQVYNPSKSCSMT
jgi:hypothetical protein